MRSARLALVPLLVLAGCPYVRSAVHEAFDGGGHDVRLPQASAATPAVFPEGTVRDLDDPLFSSETADVGFFDPRTFSKSAPLMLYALGPRQDGKTAVVFVHGMRGSPRDFRQVVQALDRSRFQPWFFYYPSGAELPELSDAFYEMVLSGKRVRTGRPMVIVAHSMGGLVVREALNHCTGGDGENPVARLVTVASPMGGLATAGGAEGGVVVIRSWRGLDPRGRYVADLHRRPLPPGLEYHLLFAFGNDQRLKVGENSDGVVPLSSQLTRKAQAESSSRYGFNASHTGVLSDPDAVHTIAAIVEGAAASERRE